MRKLIITTLVCISAFACSSKAQNKETTNCKKQNSILFEKYAQQTKINSNITNVITLFLNTPYVGGTLDINKQEKLVINIGELDCLTFVENGIALYSCVSQNSLIESQFAKNIQRLRYRNGKIKDYTSRLHYSSDWIYDNISKRIIEDISHELGGISFKPNVFFMSKNPSKYKALKDGRLVPTIKAIEEKINEREYYYIPKKNVATIQDKLQDGDIIFITTDYKGLDISHVGFAIKKDKTTHLLHASSTHKKVIISEKSLHNYLAGIKHDTGIIVCRLK